MKEIYLDNAASMPPSPAASEALIRELAESSINQESIHGGAYLLREKMEKAGRELSELLYPGRGEQYQALFGNSGTELIRLLAASPLVAGKNLVTSHLEHPAISAALRAEKCRLRELSNDHQGRVLPEFGADDEVLFLHHVQSEIGRIQPYHQILSEGRAANPRLISIVDAIQSAAKMPLPDADIVLVSGHKFGAAGGAALLVRNDFPDRAKLFDFAVRYRRTLHQCGRTEPLFVLNMPIAAAQPNRKAEIQKLNHLIREELKEEVLFTVPEEEASPYLLHFIQPGVEAAVVLRMLSQANIYAGAGSACSAESRDPSPVLTAMGIHRADAFGAFRLSFGFSTTETEIKKFLEVRRKVLKNY